MENQNEIPTIGTNKITDFDAGDVGRFEYEFSNSDPELLANQIEYARLYE